MKSITPKELHVKLASNRISILDVRSEEKYKQNPIHHENIDNIHIPKTDIFNLEENISSDISLPKDKEIIVTCTTGNSARKCVDILKDKGYQVKLLDGGVTAWDTYNQSKSK